MAARPLSVALLLVAQAAWAVAATPVAPPAPADEPVHTHVMAAGDTLIGLGRRLLADPTQWTQLARDNRVKDPRRLPVGFALRIPLRLMRTEAVPATVLASRGAVRSAGATLASGQAVAEGADVSTGDDGQATLRLVDGTVLRLRAGGRVRIDESRRVLGTDGVRSGVKLEQGRVEIQAKPARGGQPGFRIGTPQGVLAVRGTEFRVSIDGGATRGEVLEGAVAVTGSAGDPQRVAAGFGTVVDASGAASPTALLAAPDLSALPPVHERPLVRLPLAAQPGAQAYRVQVARDDSFDQVLVDLRSATPELRIAGLDDGRYPMRLRAIDARGLEGQDARGTLVLKARPEPPLPRSPAPRTVIRGTQVDLAWAANADAAHYRLQIARADGGPPDFAAPLQDRRDLTTLTASVEGLAPGAYSWRLASVRSSGDQGPYSDPLPFEMKAIPPQPAPPQPPSVGDDSVRFFWQGLPGQRFDFELASDPGFTRLIEQLSLDRTEIDLPLKGSGRFYVRLRARDADGYVGPWSSTQHFDVPNCVRDAQRGCVQVQSGPLLLQ